MICCSLQQLNARVALNAYADVERKMRINWVYLTPATPASYVKETADVVAGVYRFKACKREAWGGHAKLRGRVLRRTPGGSNSN